MNIAIITGASSGMGREFVYHLDGLFTLDEIWLIARRENLLEEIAENTEHPVRVICEDLSTPEGIGRVRKLLRKENPCIRMLINCAGYGIMGDFADQDMQEQTGMIDLNCKALTEMTYLCIPYMKANSRIIQLASSAAFLPQPGFAVYAASKAYVLSFSRALRRELSDRRIIVTAVCPGPVRTEFFDRAEANGEILAIKKYAMAEVGDVVRHALIASSRKQELAVYGPLMKGLHVLGKAVPHSWILTAEKYLMKG